MTVVSATHAKQNFAAMLDQAQREPVRIQRHDREVAVLISAEEFEKIRKLQAQQLIRLAEREAGFADPLNERDEKGAKMEAASRPATVEDFLIQVQSARADEERLRATMTSEEYALHRRQNLEELNRLAEKASAYAQANGLTEEILAEILAER